MVKSPMNWVGNKYKYINEVNKLVCNKRYKNIYESFLGSGNVLFNINCYADNYIGNEIIYLIPDLYNLVKNNNYAYVLKDFEDIEKNYNNFSANNDYYDLRNDWNKDYLTKNYSKEFVLKTVMLLKMCSNSMVRFNSKNKFNSGFRGITNGSFFKDVTKKNIIDSLNEFHSHLNKRNYVFTNDNFFNLQFEENSLLIIDPPYLLSGGIYANSINENNDKKIIENMINSNNDFLYFCYESNNGVVNNNLPLLQNYNRIYLSNKDSSGQNRANNSKPVQEVLIYNIK